MANKNFVMNKDYDAQFDVLYLRIEPEYKYKESIEIGDNIILDFDENYVPVALEILDASKFFNVDKFSLKQDIGLNMQIHIKKDFITIEAKFIFIVRNKKELMPFNVETNNDINLPVNETNFAMANA
jgi:uncharacterized protein YuzE